LLAASSDEQWQFATDGLGQQTHPTA
jgi:hypothetical protein